MRYATYVACLMLFLAALAMALWLGSGWWMGVVVFGLLSVLGTVDLLQKRSTLRRNYPLLAHFRYGLESIGPEMGQYFIESDTAEVPFSRQQRALVYQRSKSVNDTRPFGTLQGVYGSDYEWINHSLRSTYPDTFDFRITVGQDSAHPYSASVFNISAMSFGSLSANAIRALNKGRSSAGSTMTPARARSRRTTAKTAATWRGKSVPAISGAATTRADSISSASPATPAIRK